MNFFRWQKLGAFSLSVFMVSAGVFGFFVSEVRAECNTGTCSVTACTNEDSDEDCDCTANPPQCTEVDTCLNASSCVDSVSKCASGQSAVKSATCEAQTVNKICCGSADSGEDGDGLTCETGFESYAGMCFPKGGAGNADGTGLSDTPLKDIIVGVMQWILALFGFLAIIAFVISGIQYLTAAGNMNQIETAKRNMTYSILGVIVALSGLILILLIDSLLSGTSVWIGDGGDEGGL